MTKNAERQYPRKVWVLSPSFNPKEVEVVKKYGSQYYDYGDLTENGKLYPAAEMFETKEKAVEYGHRKLSAAEVKIAIQRKNIDKKRSNLEKSLSA